MQWLSQTEQRRLAGIAAQRRRDQFLAGRWLARLALTARHGGAPQDWRLTAPADAAPRVASGPVEHPSAIGLSHSGDTVACVLADAAPGIDIERHLRHALDVGGLADVALSDAERVLWLALPESERRVGLLTWWTLKEAWLKSRGRTLDIATLRRIEALPTNATKANARLWHEADFTLALVGLDAAAPLHVASPDPRSLPQWWQITEVIPPPRPAARLQTGPLPR